MKAVLILVGVVFGFLSYGLYDHWSWRRVGGRDREVIIVLRQPATRVVIVNDVVGYKLVEYLTAARALKPNGATVQETTRLSAAYRQLVMSGLDADTLKAVLAEGGVSIQQGYGVVAIGEMPKITSAKGGELK